jgi:hypothetical protein
MLLLRMMLMLMKYVVVTPTLGWRDASASRAVVVLGRS